MIIDKRCVVAPLRDNYFELFTEMEWACQAKEYHFPLKPDIIIMEEKNSQRRNAAKLAVHN